MDKLRIEKEILRSVSSIHSLADLIIIEYFQILCEKPFKIPALNQKARRIKQDAEDIKQHLNGLARVKDANETQEHAFEMLRMFKIFSTMEITQLRGFLDRIESLPIVDIEDAIGDIENK